MTDVGYPMKERTWYRWRAMLKKTMMERLYEVAQYEFPEQHLEAIEEIKAARKLMWENVHKVKDPFKQNIMIQNIINTLPLRSQYYESTKDVIQKPEQEPNTETTLQESDIEAEWEA